MDEVTNTAGQEKTQIRLDQSAARTTYSNFFLVAMGAEEFVVTFGMSTGEDQTVRISDRIVLSPRNAKRLAAAMSQAVRIYEEKLGAMTAAAPAAPASAKK